jgi:hypothetical protein
MLTDSERNTLLLGDANRALPERLPLSAGPLSLTYENGDLRYIRYGEREIIRRIYVALRGEAWFTVVPILHNIAIEVSTDDFYITYTVDYKNQERNIDFSAQFTLSGRADGTVIVEFEGEARSTFKRNRIGICVLHPAQACAGQPVTITHNHGRPQSGMFPITIQPDQPFLDIAALTQEIEPGIQSTIRFSGDVFEMEDQRNWLDASFKTYSTPQALPKPVEIPAGTRIHQTVTLKLHRNTMNFGEDAVNGDRWTLGTTTTAASFPLNPPVSVQISPGSIAPFPGFGLMLPSDELPLSEDAEAALSSIRLDHLRFDADVTQPGWQDRITEANDTAARQEVPLLLGLANFEQMRLTDRGMELQRPVEAFLFLSHTGEFIPVFGKSRPFLPAGAMLIAGSSNNFTELNRNRPEMTTVDGLVFAATPQVHSVDDTSIMETPPTFAEQLLTARTFAAGKPVLVGPLTLYRPGHGVAVQQHGIMGAAWYVAALSYAAQGAAARITLCDLSGPQGILSEDGLAYPVYYALTAVGTASGGSTQAVTISDPLHVACLSVIAQNSAWQDIFLVNLQPSTTFVTLSGIQGVSARIRTLDETTGGTFSAVVPLPVQQGMLSLSLLPYAVMQVISGAAVY